jgi:conjugal transfer/type IV secretion protein DotA/TraY
MAGNYILEVQKFSAGKFEALGYVNEGVINNTWRTCIKGTIECDKSDDSIASKISGWFSSNEKVTTMPMMNVVQQALKVGSPMDDKCGAQDLACSAINFDSTMSNRLNAAILNGLGAVGNVVANGGSTVGAFVGSGGSNGNAATSAPTVQDFAGHTSPFIAAQTLGLGLNAMAGLAMAALAALYVSGHAVGDSALSLAGGAGISAAVDFIASSMRPILALIFVSGMSLAYLTPMLIIIRWLWVILNWMIMLVEAVIASTLAVVLMITPEGEGILGSRLQQAVTLITQVIITPALNVLALFAVLVVSMAGYGLLNMFWFSNVGFEGQGLLSGVFKLFMYVITLNAMLWSILEIPTVLKSAIVTWFGGHSSSGLQSNIADKAESTTKTVEGAIGSGVGGAVGGLKKAKDNKEE